MASLRRRIYPCWFTLDATFPEYSRRSDSNLDHHLYRRHDPIIRYEFLQFSCASILVLRASGRISSGIHLYDTFVSVSERITS